MAFNAEKVKNEIVEWIRAWFEENGPGCNAVLGISGGKDSSVTAALCAEALGRDKVIGVLLPNGEQFDINVSKALCEHLGIKNYVVNITKFRFLVRSLCNCCSIQRRCRLLTKIRPCLSAWAQKK